MKLINLGSSSSGNSYYIELERNTLPPVKLMLEVGFPLKELHKKCMLNNININDIETFLVTHNHNDHNAATKELIKRGKKVFGNSYVTGNNPITTLTHNEKRYIATDTSVIPFKVEHDAPDTFGYIISTGIETILFINDCKYFAADLSRFKFDYIFIEANYDGQSIHFAYENAKDSTDNINIKRYERLFNSHMSIKNTVEHLKRLDLKNCKAIFLMHLSDKNSNEHLFIKRVKEATGIKTYACKKNGGLV